MSLARRGDLDCRTELVDDMLDIDCGPENILQQNANGDLGGRYREAEHSRDCVRSPWSRSNLDAFTSESTSALDQLASQVPYEMAVAQLSSETVLAPRPVPTRRYSGSDLDFDFDFDFEVDDTAPCPSTLLSCQSIAQLHATSPSPDHVLVGPIADSLLRAASAVEPRHRLLRDSLPIGSVSEPPVSFQDVERSASPTQAEMDAFFGFVAPLKSCPTSERRVSSPMTGAGTGALFPRTLTSTPVPAPQARLFAPTLPHSPPRAPVRDALRSRSRSASPCPPVRSPSEQGQSHSRLEQSPRARKKRRIRQKGQAVVTLPRVDLCRSLSPYEERSVPPAKLM